MQTVDCICIIDIFAGTPKAVPAALPLTPLVAHPQPVAFQTLYLLEAVGHGGDGAAQEVTRLERRGLRAAANRYDPWVKISSSVVVP